jgi:hypothetical protein
VNALYYADSLGQLMRTELNAFIWWDLRNGRDTKGSMDPVLYGWRLYGDLGMIDSLTNRYPPFYAAKLMQYFARPGDKVLSASSDYPLLASYAVRRASGGVNLLVINKDPVSSFPAQISVDGFSPNAAAKITTYGIPQDNAAQTGIGAPDIAQANFQGTSSNFNYNFPPYSLTLFTFSPVAPKLVPGSPAVQGDQFIMQLQGQAGVRYVLQTSTNLATWVPVSTNLPFSSFVNLTNAANTGAPSQFWRAIWEP